MDKEGCLINSNRLIVQIDSLMRIKQYNDNGDIDINKYDLIIVDEIEGNLNHYSSPFLEKSDQSARSVFNFMLMCMKNAKKVLLLDADIGVRTKLLAHHFENSMIINNNYKPVQRAFIITNDSIPFEKDILYDISSGKNVCIVSMTAGYIEKLSTKLDNRDVKYLMHTSHSDDKLKDKLENVNKYWSKYNVILYSPCIESGVDFNVDHFDKIYCILKDGQCTCSQRSFLQMVGRIRKVRDNNIRCLYTGPTNIDSSIYTYDDVLSYFRHYETMNGKKIIQNIIYEEIIKGDTIKLKRKTTEISLYDNICIHNEVEQLNKHRNIFMTVLNKSIQVAGHKLKFDITQTPKKSKNKEKQISLKEKIISVDESEYDIKTLIKKQSKNDLDETEKLALKKLFLIKTFGITNTNEQSSVNSFLNDFFKKELQFKRFEDFFGYKELSDIDDYDNLSIAKKKLRSQIVVDILNRFLSKNKKKYTSDYLTDVEIDGEQYAKAMIDIADNSLYFKNEGENRSLFFKSKGKFGKICEKNKQYYANTIQTLLELFSIKLMRGKCYRKKDKLVYKYSLSVDENIKKIVDFKYDIVDEIDIYTNIFKK
jgi:hypothetical protein